jgi:hypothetical protein
VDDGEVSGDDGGGGGGGGGSGGGGGGCSKINNGVSIKQSKNLKIHGTDSLLRE